MMHTTTTTMHYHWIFLIVGGVALLQGSCKGDGGGYGSYGGYPEVKANPYLPAPPGQTPACAKAGMTYCEKIDTYPTEVISYLLYKWGRAYGQFIRSETEQDYVPPPPPPPPKPQVYKEYGPPGLPYDSYFPRDNYGGYQNQNYQYQQPGNSSTWNNAGQGQGHSNNRNGYASSSASLTMAAAVPPILHSIWWNHRDVNTGAQAYPHMTQYNNNNNNNQQRWRRRVKRQQGSALSLCPITSGFFSPQAAMNNDGNWMFVVNQGQSTPQYRQLVRTETCAQGDGSPCNNVCSVAPGRRATCRQKYVQKRLVALDGSGGSLRNDVFWFPHCCSCEIS